MKPIFTITIAVLLFLLGGCQTTNTGPEIAHPLEDKVWNLVELHGEAVPVVMDLTNPSLIFDHQTMWAMGNSGVNRYTSSYAISGDSLQFGPLISTGKPGSEAAETFEDSCQTAFKSVTKWRISGTQLKLISEEGVVAVFTSKAYPLDAQDLATATHERD